MNSKLYLRHDVYTLDDAKVMGLVYKYHAEGYGVFWAVVERLTAEPSHRVQKDMLAMQTAMKLCTVRPDKVLAIIRYSIELGLLKEKDGIIYNERVERQCRQVEEYSKTQSQNVRKRWDKYREEHSETEAQPEQQETAEAGRNERREIAQSVIDRYHELCPSLPHVRTVTDARVSHCYSFAGFFSNEAIEEGFRKAEASDFLKNGNGTWNGANLDWLVNRNNFSKVLEGNYENRPSQRRSSVCNDSATMAEGGNGQGGFDL